MSKEIDLYKLYSELYRKLLKISSAAGIETSQLKNYFIPDGKLKKESKMCRLAYSLQNSGMMHNSIRFETDNKDIIEKVLFSFNAGKITDTYSSHKDLYEAFINSGIIDNGIGKNKETNWDKYARGLFDGATFLSKENGENTLDKLIKFNGSGISEEMFDEIKNIQNRIHGLGFALTCDWLKECGCTWLAKPDVHIKKVCEEITRNTELNDKDVIRFMFEWAKEIETQEKDITAYKLDKVIWLICTGNFYLDNVKFGRDIIIKTIKNIS